MVQWFIGFLRGDKSFQGMANTSQLNHKVAYANGQKQSHQQLGQDYFWTFCIQLWKNKDITEDNILAEAHAGAKAYLDQLRKTGVLST